MLSDTKNNNKKMFKMININDNKNFGPFQMKLRFNGLTPGQHVIKCSLIIQVSGEYSHETETLHIV